MKKFKIYFWKDIPKKLFKEVKKVKKERLKDYMNVYLCDTYEEMYQLSDKLEKTKLERDYAGRTWCYSKNYYDIETGKYVKTSPCCGHIVFTKEYYWMDSITHECCHAVIGYFSRKMQEYRNIFIECDEQGNFIGEQNINTNEDSEELFCYMVGNLSNQIACKGDENE